MPARALARSVMISAALAGTLVALASAFRSGKDETAGGTEPAMPGMSCSQMPEMAGCPGAGGLVTLEGTGDLQQMVGETASGETLLVPAGVHHGNLVIDHPLVLDGMGTATLDAGGSGTVITITAPNVTVKGLTLSGSGDGPVGQPSGITVEEADHVLIQNVTIEDTYAGVIVRRAAGVTVENSTIRGRSDAAVLGEMHVVGGEGGEGMTGANVTTRGDGVSLWNSTDVTIANNRFLAVRDGVYVSFGTGVLIENNLILDSRYGIHTMYPQDFTARSNTLDGNLNGIVLMYGGPSMVEGNTIEHSGSPSTGFAVLVKDAGGVTVERNILVDNRIGIHVDNGSATAGGPTLVKDNTIALNQIGADVMSSSRVSFEGNSFVENVSQALMTGSGGSDNVHWMVEGRGNFWNTYQGFDAEGDGVGDVPYTETGRLDDMISRAPVMTALASGPGLRLFGSIADRWVPDKAVVNDPYPLIRPTSPMLRSSAGDRPPVALWVPGLLAVLGCGAAVSRGRKPNRPRKDSRHAA